MTWSYSVADLATVPKDQIRLLIGDTNQNDKQLQDEEVSFLLTLRSSIWGAAALCCESISANYSRLADTTTGELRTLYSSRSRAYNARATYYEQMSAILGGAAPSVGGISVAAKLAAEQDPDRVAPYFNRDMMDNFNQPLPPVGNESGAGAGDVGVTGNNTV